MEDSFKNEYKFTFDNIHASDDLRRRVLDAKPSTHKIHVITPFKAAIGTIAAAVMIFAAVNEYGFKPDTSGVISETVVSTQLPEAQFVAVDTPTQAPAATEKPEKKTKTNAVVKPRPVATQKPVITEAPVVTSDSEPVAQSIDEEPIAPRIGGGGQVQEEVSVTECEPFDISLSGTVVPTEFGFKGYKISGELYYIIEGTDEAAVMEKVNVL